MLVAKCYDVWTAEESTITCPYLQANKFVVHDPDYRQALQDFTTFLEKLTEKVTEVDETIPDLPVKDIVSHYPYSRFRLSNPEYQDLPNL